MAGRRLRWTVWISRCSKGRYTDFWDQTAPVARRALLKVIVGEVAGDGRTVFSTHLLSDIEAVADTISIIKGGKLLASGDLDDLRESHRTFRIVYAEVPPEEEIEALKELPDVRETEREGRGIRVGVRGDVQAVE